MSPLFLEVHRWAGLPHVWGQTDCMLVLCDWVAQVTGVDPAADLRNTYCDAASCQRATGFLRDPVGVAGRHFEAAGLVRTDAPVAGDVAVIRRADDAATPLGALCLGSSWATKGPKGTTTLNPLVVDVQAAWSVGYEA